MYYYVKIACYQQFKVNVQRYRIDNAKDFCNSELKEFFDRKGIRHETSCPYAS